MVWKSDEYFRPLLRCEKSSVISDHCYGVRDWLLMQFMLSSNTHNSLYLCGVGLLAGIQCGDSGKVRIIWEIVDELMQKIDDAVKLYQNLKKNQWSCMHIAVAILTGLQGLCSFTQCKHFLFFFMLHTSPDSSTITLLQRRQQGWKWAGGGSAEWWTINELMTAKCRPQVDVWGAEFMLTEWVNGNGLVLWLQEVHTDCKMLKNRSWGMQ